MTYFSTLDFLNRNWFGGFQLILNIPNENIRSKMKNVGGYFVFWQRMQNNTAMSPTSLQLSCRSVLHWTVITTCFRTGNSLEGFHFLWYSLLSLRELTELVQSSMWQWAIKSNAFPNNYSTFLLVLGDTRLHSKWLATWEVQLSDGNALPGTVPLTNWNYQLRWEIRKWKFLSVSCFLLELPY